jgi:hypothetical protein
MRFPGLRLLVSQGRWLKPRDQQCQHDHATFSPKKPAGILQKRSGSLAPFSTTLHALTAPEAPTVNSVTDRKGSM